jgi:hypothetical protein
MIHMVAPDPTVGTAGFEPATPCSQSATISLRMIAMISSLRCGGGTLQHLELLCCVGLPRAVSAVFPAVVAPLSSVLRRGSGRIDRSNVGKKLEASPEVPRFARTLVGICAVWRVRYRALDRGALFASSARRWRRSTVGRVGHAVKRQ